MVQTPKRPPPEPLLISVKELAAMLGISRGTAYDLLDKQLIESRYIGRRRLVLKSSVDDFVTALPDRPPSRY